MKLIDISLVNYRCYSQQTREIFALVIEVYQVLCLSRDPPGHMNLRLMGLKHF